MLFHSTTFAVFFILVFVGFWLLHRWRTPRVLFLLTASYIFYMGWSAKFALLIVFQTVSDYYLALLLNRLQSERWRKLLLAVSVCVNLGILALFKYYNFFVDSFAQGCHYLGWEVSAPVLDLVLPVGISFYTFHTLSYVLDVYYRKIPPARNLWEFALAVVFFPQLVAGPIVRAAQFLPQMESTPRFELDNFRSGLLQFLTGLCKKVIIADTLAQTLVDPAFAKPQLASGAHMLLAVYGYAFQIYGDFSGYSDMALGTARMLGYELPINFNLPYRAVDLREFWQRWHISLSTFLRDYLYVPVGGSRGGILYTSRNLMITMLLGGLWHGASWTFVLWGFYHGLLLTISHAWSRLRPAPSEGSASGHPGSRWGFLSHAARVVLTFNLVCVGWIFFRAQSFGDISVVFERILTWAPAETAVYASYLHRPRGLIILALAFAVHYAPREHLAPLGAWLQRRSAVALGCLTAAALAVVSLFHSSNHPFIYFQF